jgi:DNA primase large subunit
MEENTQTKMDQKKVAITDASLNQLKNEIEVEGIQKVKEVYANKLPINSFSEALLQIMKDGSKQFTEKTGREMTYAEMRYLYG